MTSAGSGQIITSTERTKLSGIETGADVTDSTNVLAAGAVMDSGNQTIAGVKTFSDDMNVQGTLDVTGSVTVENTINSVSGDSNGTKYVRQSTFYFGKNNSSAQGMKFYKLFVMPNATSFVMRVRLTGTWIEDANCYDVIISYRKAHKTCNHRSF